MIEEALKIIVGLSYEIIQATTPSPVRFRFDPAEITDAALPTLRKAYVRVSRNDAVAKKISQLIRWRDYCAHRAFQAEFMSRIDTRFESEKDASGLATATRAALEVLESLGDEMAVLRAVHDRLNIRKASSNDRPGRYPTHDG